VNAKHGITGGTGFASGLWPVLLSLLVVLIPTACVLWFLSEAVQNERLAARQRLTEAYRGYLPMLRSRLETYWQQQAVALDVAAGKSPAPAAFAACVSAGLVDSVVCYDASGRLAYPAPVTSPKGQPAEDGVWENARLLEYARNEPTAAAAAYAALASKTSDDGVAAQALQAQARCLARAGHTTEAVRLLADTLGNGRFAQVLDPQGRLLAADAQLRALELLGDCRRPGFEQIAHRLAKRLADYRTPTLPAAQRRFLMKELGRLAPGTAAFPTLKAEELAAAYLEVRWPSPGGALQPSGLPGVWHFAPPGGRIVGLLRGQSVLQRTAALMAADALPAEVQIGMVPPEMEAAENVEQVLPAGAKMPGWRLTLLLRHDQPSDAAADRQVAAYVWIAVLVIVAMSIVAVLVAEALRRQLRLARLKNDLLATVSHELKTPLSSIRLLVDTLLDEKNLEGEKTRDYLRLVAKENAWLTHLIDNFLSFSRMERGKQMFEFAAVPAAEISERAVEALGERFQAPACRLEVDTAAHVPAVMADGDALVTAVLNLLDNAYKYSADGRHIVLRTYAENGDVCFAVSDNGIGLSPRAAKRVFRPFYQVDRRLSRSTGGCGLGLSIVKFIIAAHGGTIRVESQSGQGSTFTIAIPGATADSPQIRTMERNTGP
jgi:signal transduction histidine kinase